MANAFTETIAAGDKQAGYDYQFFIFILKCLDLKPEETIGYEEKDDVHIQTPLVTTFIQVKHTTTLTSGQTRPNLTQKDNDLWKTIHNWISVINDSVSGRNNITEQKKFIEKSEFILLSNKSHSDNNAFLKTVSDLKSNGLSIALVRSQVESLIATLVSKPGSTPSEVDNHIQELLGQTDEWIRLFLSRLSFSLDEDKIVDDIKKRIESRFMITQTGQIQVIYECILANLKTKTYQAISQGKRSVSYNFDTVKSMLSPCIHPDGNKVIIRRNITLDLPENLAEQNFIKQLIDIGDIQAGDKDLIEQYTKFKLLMAYNLREWEQDNELLPTMMEEFILDCITKWRNCHRRYHRDFTASGVGAIAEAQLKTAAQNCIDEIRTISLFVTTVPLDTNFSNGQFYHLNDSNLIGWIYDWETRYK